tara:strand:- start:13 stop:1200 length:1188 start_codon:yes stop_codon:yes gene_type:complete
MKISVIGLGKAGLPLAAVIADKGIDVLGVDIDKNRVDMINSGENPIPEEPGLKEIIEKQGGKHLKATTDASEAAKACDVHFVIVPLFIDKNKKPDFSILRQALEKLAKDLKKEDVVILETTVPVGTTEGMVKDILEKGSKLKSGEDFYLAFSPERIMTGYSIKRYRDFPKLVGGINEKSTEKALKAYAFGKPIAVSNAKTAELAKVAEGIYRDVNIALANELLKVSEHYNIDFWEMKEAAKHQYCNILDPGNVGGHCIPVYPWFLINEMDVPLIKKSREVNDDMVNYYFGKIKNIVGERSNTKIGIIGLSYREGVKENAYSRSIAIIELLKKKGYDVYGLDPLYSEEETENNFSVKYLNDLDKMDAIIIMNKSTEYKDKLMKLKNKIVDVKNMLK